MASLADLRQEYSAGGLSETDVGMDPFALFRHWLDQAIAAGLSDPNAFTLATCTPDGWPSARAVPLQGPSGVPITGYSPSGDHHRQRLLAASG